MKDVGFLYQKVVKLIPLWCAALVIPVAGAAPLLLDPFAVFNSNADGFVTTPSAIFAGDSSSFDLTGGNNGTGFGGETDFFWIAPVSGTVAFEWSYTACDPPNQDPQSPACDLPGLDWAGYFIDQTPTLLTDTDTQGVASLATFTVTAGQTFGWFVGTFDNTFGPGTLTASAITFSSDIVTGGDAPEPSSLYLGISGFLITAAIWLRSKQRENKSGGRA